MIKQLVCLMLFVFGVTGAATKDIVHLENISTTKYCAGIETTSGKKPKNGMIALSRDLIRKHNIEFGSIVHVCCIGTFTFEDTMPPQWSRRCDIYTTDKKAAYRFGKEKHNLTVVKKYGRPVVIRYKALSGRQPD